MSPVGTNFLNQRSATAVIHSERVFFELFVMFLFVCLQYKTLRSLVMNGAAEHDEFFQQLRAMEPAFVLGVKDLRSQVVREACVTIA
jgi:hypothetical protein